MFLTVSRLTSEKKSTRSRSRPWPPVWRRYLACHPLSLSLSLSLKHAPPPLHPHSHALCYTRCSRGRAQHSVTVCLWLRISDQFSNFKVTLTVCWSFFQIYKCLAAINLIVSYNVNPFLKQIFLLGLYCLVCLSSAKLEIICYIIINYLHLEYSWTVAANDRVERRMCLPVFPVD